MKKSSLIIAFVFLCSLSFAQTYESTGTEDEGNKDTVTSGIMDPIRKPIDGVYKKVHKPQYIPIGLQHVREADILYATLTWSVIDLREKMNHPLYFPTESKGNWKSLMQAILDVTTDSSEANPNPVYVYDDEYLTQPFTREGLTENMGESYMEEDLNDWGEVVGQKPVYIPWGPKEIYQYIIKDQYITDKQRSVMEPRIMAICPMFWYEKRETGGSSYDEAYSDTEDDMPAATSRRWRKFGWLYYNEMRPTFAVTEVFNPKNNAQRRSYDDVFLMRHFASFFRGEENVYNNRQIDEYIVNGMDQRLEAERIKNSIREREHDMWEF